MTRRFSVLLILALTAAWSLDIPVRAAGTNGIPDFSEVYGLLKSNVPGGTDLNRAAVEGLLSRLQGRVSIVGDGMSSGTNLVPGRSSVLSGNIAYLRAAGIGDGFADAAQSAYQVLTATNPADGLVLDLRYADGEGFPGTESIVKWCVSRKNSGCPVAVLVNVATRGAAERLASALQTANAALILGSPTSGQVMKDFPLSNGQVLRIAAGQTSAAGSSAVQPDILVTLNPDDEKAYFDNAFALLAKASDGLGGNLDTNQLPDVERISEADLVREKRNQENPDAFSDNPHDTGGDEARIKSARAADPIAVIRDPALVRAVDLLKGLAVMRKPRS